MNSIVYIGMDVHKDSYTLACYDMGSDKVELIQKIKSDYRFVLKYINKAQLFYGQETTFICGYEAGSLGFTLYNQLTDAGVNCIILAPSTMSILNTGRVKTDKNDAANIAKNLAFNTYSAVNVPTQEDLAVKEYIRLRDDRKLALKRHKQQILAFVLRHGHRYRDGESSKSYWTLAHVKWLRSLSFDGLLKETMDELMIEYDRLVDKLEKMDDRIEEIASGERYLENVKKLSCLIGVKTYTALSIIVEIGDFNRFKSAEKFAKFIGLTPTESSSGASTNRGAITKAGNSIVRRLIVESSQSYCRGHIGHISKELKKRQRQVDPQVTSYANKANERLRKKYYKLILSSNKPRNKAAVAVARELSCFMWGLMTNNIA